MNDIDARKKKEKNRLKKLLTDAGVDAWKIKMLQPVIDNVAWMSVKLEDSIEAIADDSVAIPYDNGGGQKGIRQNPAYTGYEALWKSYLSGMTQVLNAAGEKKDTKTEKLKPASVIALVRSKRENA